MARSPTAGDPDPPKRNKRKNPYRPGTASYANWRQTELRRRAALAEATAKRAKQPEARQKAKRRAAAARRGLREIAPRQDYRSSLSERDRDAFGRFSIGAQNKLLAMLRDYPERTPSKDVPDPFADDGEIRNRLWRLYYSTRAGSRQRQAA